MVEVILTDEALEWLRGLPRVHQAQVGKALDKLELRVRSGGHALRVFYSFDPVRNAVVLMGGDKTGANSDSFYVAMIAVCERIWKQYLAEHARGEHEE